MIEQELVTALSSLGYKPYPLELPEDVTYPAISYQVIFDGTDQATNGSVCGQTVRIQVDIWAKKYSEAKSLKALVVESIVNDLKGGFISAQDLKDPVTKLHRQLIDFTTKRS